MLYWNGTAWVTVAPGISLPGNQAQTLSYCNGVPTWGPCPGSLATLNTTSISGISNSTANSGGNITNDGGANIIARGICYDTSPSPTIANSTVNNGTGTGIFTCSISGLSPITTYYVRAFATNSVGTSYGNDVNFTTNPISLATLTTSAVNISGIAVSSGGNITNDGGATVTARGVCYSTSANPTISNSFTVDGSGIGSYTSSTFTNLTPGAIYFVRAYATNSIGTAYGNPISFTAPSLSIGQSFAGGVIAYLDGTGYHGLIAAPSDQSTGIFWHASASGVTNATATAFGTGNANTNAIIALYGSESNAAKICADLVLGGFSDWYLPSKDEMTQLFSNRIAIGGFNTNFYWTSSESGAGVAVSFYFFNGNSGNYNKTDMNSVRAVRTF